MCPIPQMYYHVQRESYHNLLIRDHVSLEIRKLDEREKGELLTAENIQTASPNKETEIKRTPRLGSNWLPRIKIKTRLIKSHRLIW